MRALLASAGPDDTGRVKDAIRNDASIPTLRKLVALEQLDLRLKSIEAESNFIEAKRDEVLLVPRRLDEIVSALGDPHVRAAATQRAAKWPHGEEDRAAAARRVAFEPGRSDAEYQAAMAIAGSLPTNDRSVATRAFLAMCQYRLGRHDLAFRTADEADRDQTTRPVAGELPNPKPALVKALAAFRLGWPADAARLLDVVRNMPMGREHVDDANLFREAEALIAPPIKRPAIGPTTRPMP